MLPSGFRPDKTHAASFLNGFKNIPGKACVNRVHNYYAVICECWKILARKNHILKRSVLSADKTSCILIRRRFINIKSLPYKVTRCIINRLIGQWAYELLMSFEGL